MKAPGARRILGIALGATALACIVAGAVRTHTTYFLKPQETNEPPIFAPGGMKIPMARVLPPKIITETIGEAQLIVDATFTGVVRKGDRLMTQYDRTKPAGRRACPT